MFKQKLELKKNSLRGSTCNILTVLSLAINKPLLLLLIVCIVSDFLIPQRQQNNYMSKARLTSLENLK